MMAASRQNELVNWTVFICMLGAILYAAVVTQFTFDFFAPADPYWQGYNQLALSFLDGRVDVPATAIGYEGHYFEGKVYLNNYGPLPAIARLPLALFIDLETTSTARIVASLVAVATSLVFQRTLYNLLSASQGLLSDQLSYYRLLSLVNWFLSGAFFLVQRANIMHEGYAFSLLLIVLMVHLVIRHYVFGNLSWSRMIKLVATCAGLIVLCRPTLALGAYAFVVILVLARIDWRNTLFWRMSGFVSIASTAFWPLSILLAFGMTFIGYQWLKYGQLSLPSSVGFYGYFLFVEGYSARFLSGLENSRFEAGRILPNLLYYTVPYADLHQRLIDTLAGGTVYIYRPVILWPLLLAIPVTLTIKAIRQFMITDAGIGRTLKIAGLFALGFPILLMLSYTTISARYVTEIWLLLYGALAAFAVFVATSEPDSEFRKRISGRKILRAGLVIALLYTPVAVLQNQVYWNGKRDPEQQIADQRELGNWPLTQEYIDALLATRAEAEAALAEEREHQR